MKQYDGLDHESVFRAIFLYNEFDMPNLDDPIKAIKNSRKTLFILCGLPYAGKSFIAEGLRKNTDVVYVSIDAIFHTHGFDWNTNTLPDAEAWQKIFDESYEISKIALQDCKNVLYDSTNHTRASRDALRVIAYEVGAQTQVIFVNVSHETIWKRWEENCINPSRSIVSKELVQQTIYAFEAPTTDERVIDVMND